MAEIEILVRRIKEVLKITPEMLRIAKRQGPINIGILLKDIDYSHPNTKAILKDVIDSPVLDIYFVYHPQLELELKNLMEQEDDKDFHMKIIAMASYIQYCGQSFCHANRVESHGYEMVKGETYKSADWNKVFPDRNFKYVSIRIWDVEEKAPARIIGVSIESTIHMILKHLRYIRTIDKLEELPCLLSPGKKVSPRVHALMVEMFKQFPMIEEDNISLEIQKFFNHIAFDCIFKLMLEIINGNGKVNPIT